MTKIIMTGLTVAIEDDLVNIYHFNVKRYKDRRTESDDERSPD